MALKLERGALLAGLLSLLACTPAPDAPLANKTPLSFEDAPRKADRETVVVLTPLEAETQELWQSLVLELGEEFNVVTVPVHRSTAADDLSSELNRLSPQCVVVVDNRTLQLYRDLQRMRPNHQFPPAVAVMTSFLDRAIGSLRTTTGIAYEVPAVSGVVALREVAKLKVERVGVLHRETFTPVVEAQARLAAIEKIELVTIAVPDKPTAEEIEESLDSLVIKQRVDALWVLNDNGLLSAEFLVSSWLPVLQFKPVPVIVGVSALVHPDVNFGTLAVYPHHARLGVQTANLVFDLADNDWHLKGEKKVELPLSVMTVVDIDQVTDHFGLKADALAKIDKVVR
jgi:hypothetical protein